MPTRTAVARVHHVHDRSEDQSFQSIGQFLVAVQRIAVAPNDPLAQQLVATERAERTQNTNVGSEGGFAVPPSLLENRLAEGETKSPLTRNFDRRTVTIGNRYRGVFVDESTLVDGSRFGEIEMPTVAEGGTIPYVQVKVRAADLSLFKSGGIIPATNEMVEDVESFGADMSAIMLREVAFIEARDALLGTGVGAALGMAKSPTRVEVAIEGTQTIANTPAFITKNLANMVARTSRFASAAWYMNQDIFTAIATATVNSNAVPLLTPPDALAPFGRLLTRPVYPIDAAPAVGTVGDLGLLATEDYLWVQKGGLKSDVSVHVRFLQDESLYRFTIRVNGQPKSSSPITPFAGANTRSPYVFLAARS